ncbi:MAG: hypothetical protein ACOYM7_05520 [Paludibacter sp.]
MKKTILLLVIFSLFSCEGELGISKQCWKFDVKTTVKYRGDTSVTTGVVDKCDLTTSEANKYMEDLNTTVTTTSGGYTMTTTTVCTGKTLN